MRKMGLNEIREKYLSFFESKEHLRLKSFPLVPQGDKGLLIINSGMAPMKPYFSGESAPPSKRVTTCQKCVRTTDIENVGITSRHATFFEMLGNFSFGDYFKKEACAWAWEFFTTVLGIPKEKLYVSVYLDDDEAFDIWTKEVGIEPSHMKRLGKEDNFWEIGAGPCGPCSEIYYDRGGSVGCGKPDCSVGCDCDRFVEVWNLVFTQFNHDGNGGYTPLVQKNIDTGMGLERIACVMQGVSSLWDVDTVLNITEQAAKLTGVSYGKDSDADISLRIIADHVRASVMMISDGMLPSNEGRGYVLRRLLRRAAMHGRLLGHDSPFLHLLCKQAVAESGGAYPELVEKQDYIIRVIQAEEERFNLTLDSGLRILEGYIEELKTVGENTLGGTECFKLYDTYGFPVDMTIEVLSNNGMSADTDGFSKCMDEQRERARAATAAIGDFGWESLDLGLPKDEETIFTGYGSFEDKAKILAIVSDSELCSSVREGQNALIVLDKTPFYAEMGGQVSDTGLIADGKNCFEVTQVNKSKDGKYIHAGTVKNGSFSVDVDVTASLDAERRRAIMRAHSATHLLHAALKKILGTHVEQAGSQVMPDMLRFDFTHFSAMTQDELSAVSDEVNEQILNALDINVREMALEDAKKSGAAALFGEKYGDIVRVVRMGDYSSELCGGTHLDNTAKSGCFTLTSEFSVAAGVRRIEASVGKRTVKLMNETANRVRIIADELKTSPAELRERVTQHLSELKESKRMIDKLRERLIRGEADRFFLSSRDVGGFAVITSLLNDVDSDWLKKAGDLLRDKSDRAIAVLAAVNGGKITFLSACGKEAVKAGIKAGDLIKLVTGLTGGSGGGKPDIAMGGGKNKDEIERALSAVDAFIKDKVNLA